MAMSNHKEVVILWFVWVDIGSKHSLKASPNSEEVSQVGVTTEFSLMSIPVK